MERGSAGSSWVTIRLRGQGPSQFCPAAHPSTRKDWRNPSRADLEGESRENATFKPKMHVLLGKSAARAPRIWERGSRLLVLRGKPSHGGVQQLMLYQEGVQLTHSRRRLSVHPARSQFPQQPQAQTEELQPLSSRAGSALCSPAVAMAGEG